MILINKKVVVIWIWKHVKLSCPFPHFRPEIVFLTYDTVRSTCTSQRLLLLLLESRLTHNELSTEALIVWIWSLC